jgi:hypothetical protein
LAGNGHLLDSRMHGIWNQQYYTSGHMIGGSLPQSQILNAKPHPLNSEPSTLNHHTPTLNPTAPYRFFNCFRGTGEEQNAELVRMHTGAGFQHPDGTCVLGVVLVRTIKVLPPLYLFESLF